MSDMNQFFTRARANEGIKLPLDTPDGSPTEHWLRIRGVDSDIFQAKQREQIREIAVDRAELNSIEDKKERATEVNKRQEERELILLSTLISEWSFEEPCTEENVLNFLREAPQIREEINNTAGRRALFFKNGPSS